MDTKESQNKFSKDYYNRREFLKASGLISTGLFFTPFLHSSPLEKPGKNSLNLSSTNNHFIPLFIQDSCSRLGLASDFIDAGIKHSIHKDINYIVPGNAFNMGSLIKYQKSHLLEALEKIKSEYNILDFESSRRFSLISGALVHQAARVELKMTDSEKQSSEIIKTDIPESKVYQDATIIRAYLNKGKKFSKGDEVLLTNLFNEMIPRILIRFHTIRPDTYNWPDIKAGEDWIMKMEKWRNQIDSYFKALGNIITNPDPKKIKLYISEPNFFNHKDPLLTKISIHAKVAEINKEEAIQTIEMGKKGSICSRAIAAGYETLLLINDFFSDELSMAEVNDKLKII